MQYFLTGKRMQAADRYTIETLGIPSLTLMERAAEACVNIMEAEGIDLSKPCVVCGSGNNGGDGFAIARMLSERGHTVQVCMAGNISHCTEETSCQIERLKRTGTKICDGYVPGEYSIIVDAMFGVGLNREVAGHYSQIIRQMNEADGVKFSVDIPSGISADSGMVLGTAFRADMTVTFQKKKIGLMLPEGRSYAGKLVAVDIGINTEQAEKAPDTVYALDAGDYRKLLPARPEDSNKGSFGKLLVIAGSKGMSGAAYLNAAAAYKSGAGLVQIYTAEENRTILQTLLPEAIIQSYERYDEEKLLSLLAWADAVCIGSGIGMGEDSRRILETTLKHISVPCLIDADGLNLMAEHPEYWDDLPEGASVVITPHMKEMSRLLDVPVSRIKEERLSLLKLFTDTHPAVCILKDSRTLTAASGGQSALNLSGNAAMAKAGSGDVLAGITAGLMVQGLSCMDAALLGTFVHGLSGDLAREEMGPYSVMAGDLIRHVGNAFLEILKTQKNNKS